MTRPTLSQINAQAPTSKIRLGKPSRMSSSPNIAVTELSKRFNRAGASPGRAGPKLSKTLVGSSRGASVDQEPIQASPVLPKATRTLTKVLLGILFLILSVCTGLYVSKLYRAGNTIQLITSDISISMNKGQAACLVEPAENTITCIPMGKYNDMLIGKFLRSLEEDDAKANDYSEEPTKP